MPLRMTAAQTNNSRHPAPAPIKRPKLDGFIEIIEQWLRDDVGQHRKQRHTAKRVFDRLREEHGFAGGYTIVKDYVREHQRRRRNETRIRSSRHRSTSLLVRTSLRAPVRRGRQAKL